MVDIELIEQLPLEQRLALAYAPKWCRSDQLNLLLFENEMGGILRKASEPIIAQMRLAWWRDSLNKSPEQRPRGNVILDRLSGWADEKFFFIEAINGWESLLSERMESDFLQALVESRAAVWGALATRLAGVEYRDRAAQAARIYVLADLAANLGDEEERDVALSIAHDGGMKVPSLPRALRSLAILAKLGARSLRAGGRPLLDGPGSGLLAMRVGLLGR